MAKVFQNQPKILMQPSPYLMMLYRKLDQYWPTDFRDILLVMCGRKTPPDHRHTNTILGELMILSDLFKLFVCLCRLLIIFIYFKTLWVWTAKALGTEWMHRLVKTLVLISVWQLMERHCKLLPFRYFLDPVLGTLGSGANKKWTLAWHTCVSKYSKTCFKRPLKNRRNKDINDK